MKKYVVKKSSGTSVRSKYIRNPGNTKTGYKEKQNYTNPTIQEELVKINHQIPDSFPKNVEQEADKLRDEHISNNELALKGREDLRHIDFVTIDGENASDFDDAIYVKEDDNGFILYVAIADVSWYVRAGSALDKEAKKRGNSFYFPLSVVPMLPEVLCNDLCSLRPNEERLAMAVCLCFSKDGQLRGRSFMSAIIKSRARLTYKAVQNALDDNICEDKSLISPNLLPMLRTAAYLAQILRKKRMKRGALDMDLPEPAYQFDNKGKILSIEKAEIYFSHKMIEEFMLAANEAVAQFLKSKKIPFPYRTHDAPNQDRLDSLFSSLKNSSLPPDLLRLLHGKSRAANIKTILDKARNTPFSFVVNRLILRAMMRAEYNPEPKGHFGLASSAYCHFTSPIRRYADIIVHRALRLALGKGLDPIPARHKLLAITEMCNVRERAALEAEREAAKRMACLLLNGQSGEVFRGTISGIMSFGFFVELEHIPVDGLVRLSCLTDDWYSYDRDKSSLIGLGTGRIFSLGQKVTVRLDKVNLHLLEIDFSLIDKNIAVRTKKKLKPASKWHKYRKKTHMSGKNIIIKTA